MICDSMRVTVSIAKARTRVGTRAARSKVQLTVFALLGACSHEKDAPSNPPPAQDVPVPSRARPAAKPAPSPTSPPALQAAPDATDLAPPTAPVAAIEVVVPDSLEFRPLPAQWWKRKRSLCTGKIEHVSVEPRGETDFARAVVCRVKGQPHGPTTAFDATDRVIEESWAVHGETHGLVRTYYKEMLETQEVFQHGERHGPSKEFNVFAQDPATVMESGVWVKGTKHGRWREGSQDGLAFEGFFDAGVPEGRWVGWNTNNGKALVELGYRRGLLHGQARVWRRVDATALAIGEFDDGSGQWRAVYADGETMSQLECEQRTLVGGTWRDPAGAVSFRLRVEERIATLTNAEGRDVPGGNHFGGNSICGDSPLLLLTSGAWFPPTHMDPR